MSGVQFGTQIDMNGLKVTEVADGTDPTDAVTLSQLDAVAPDGFAAVIGDGLAVSYPVVHNFGTLDVLVQVVRISDGATVTVTVVRTDTNTVTVSFTLPPLLNAYRVLVVPVP